MTLPDPAKLKRELELRKATLGPDHPHTLDSMHNLGVGYSALGRHVEAVRLLGVSATLTSRTGALAPPIFTQAADIEADARKTLGDETFAREQAEGARMTIEEAVAYVESLPVTPGPGPTSLSPGVTGDGS